MSVPPGRVKWGIIGCADIARKTCDGITESKNATCVAVGSRDLAKAQAFVEANCPTAHAYGSYQEVLDDPAVQVVYVPLPTAFKKDWVLKAAKAKKHVLCDKPLAVSIEDTREMIEACAAAGVQFMDNTMFMHHDRTEAIGKCLEARELLGECRLVTSSFSIPFGNDEDWAANNIRMKKETEPFGCMGDLGWYNIRMTTLAFDYADPEQVSCQTLESTGEGVPTYCSALLKFSGGRLGRFDCSFLHPLRQWAELAGQRAVLQVDDFVVTRQREEASFTVTAGSIADKAITFPSEVLAAKRFDGCVQHVRLIETMSAIVQKGTLDPFWPKVSLQTQTIVCALLASAAEGGRWLSLGDAS